MRPSILYADSWGFVTGRRATLVLVLCRALGELRTQRETTALYRALRRQDPVVLAALAIGARRSPVRLGALRGLLRFAEEEEEEEGQ